ncbi:MAG: type II toxin-antitoxin system Phd/YefM family antitoxin [Candidatus Nanopelagicales bacterium]|jgi:antitoxin Phd
MASIQVSAARDALADVIELAATEAVVLERYGSAVAVVVSPTRYEELMDAYEEIQDIEAFDRAMADEGPNVPWAQVKADLGWQ